MGYRATKSFHCPWNFKMKFETRGAFSLDPLAFWMHERIYRIKSAQMFKYYLKLNWLPIWRFECGAKAYIATAGCHQEKSWKSSYFLPLFLFLLIPWSISSPLSLSQTRNSIFLCCEYNHVSEKDGPKHFLSWKDMKLKEGRRVVVVIFNHLLMHKLYQYIHHWHNTKMHVGNNPFYYTAEYFKFIIVIVVCI